MALKLCFCTSVIIYSFFQSQSVAHGASNWEIFDLEKSSCSKLHAFVIDLSSFYWRLFKRNTLRRVYFSAAALGRILLKPVKFFVTDFLFTARKKVFLYIWHHHEQFLLNNFPRSVLDFSKSFTTPAMTP